jgi:hypothetical protein
MVPSTVQNVTDYRQTRHQARGARRPGDKWGFVCCMVDGRPRGRPICGLKSPFRNYPRNLGNITPDPGSKTYGLDARCLLQKLQLVQYIDIPVPFDLRWQV